MGSVSSIPGPALILLYRYLGTPHQVVRATNAALYLVMPRLFIYLAMGMFDAADWGLYVGVALGGLTGMVIGDWLHRRMDGGAFSRALLALLCISCVLMFFSAAGYVR